MIADLTITFTSTGDFIAYHAAVAYLDERGFSVGIMQGPDPIGILFGRDIRVAKWRHLSAQHRAELHGAITGVSRRDGPITITIFSHAPAAARAAVSKAA